MYRKAMLFGSKEIAGKILNATSPEECKKLGRSKRIKFIESVWQKERETICYEVLMDKFSLSKLKPHLINTGDLHLVEASPFDKIWGIGMRDTDAGVDNTENWRGKNLLGEVLMTVRSELSDTSKKLS